MAGVVINIKKDFVEKGHEEILQPLNPVVFDIFKPGACWLRPHAPGFLKLLWFTYRYVCVCVCVSALKGINNKWCDIDYVRLVKQVKSHGTL